MKAKAQKEETEVVTKKADISKFDQYITLIQKTALHIASIKYEGYEQDLTKLFLLSQEDLNKKKELNTDSDLDILADKRWYKEINTIEAKINAKTTVKTDQDFNSEVLHQIREILKQNGVNIPVVIIQKLKIQAF